MNAQDEFRKWTNNISHCENDVIQYFVGIDVEKDGDILFSTEHHHQRHPYDCWVSKGVFYILKQEDLNEI